MRGWLLLKQIDYDRLESCGVKEVKQQTGKHLLYYEDALIGEGVKRRINPLKKAYSETKEVIGKKVF